jgi:hypothetical protein
MSSCNRRAFMAQFVIGSAAVAALAATRARADASPASCAQCAQFVRSEDGSSGSCGLNGGHQVAPTDSCAQFVPRERSDAPRARHESD